MRIRRGRTWMTSSTRDGTGIGKVDEEHMRSSEYGGTERMARGQYAGIVKEEGERAIAKQTGVKEA